MPIFELSTPLKWPTDALTSLARQMAAASQMFTALLAAESFISGFEDDELQEGVPSLLSSIRAIVGDLGASSVVVVKAQACGKTEGLLTTVQETQAPNVEVHCRNDTGAISSITVNSQGAVFAPALPVNAEPAEDWRPIETAPKDGTPILARYMWLGEHRYLVIRRSQQGPWWLADHDGFIKHNDEKNKPGNYDFTHWSPISPPVLDSSAASLPGGRDDG